MTTSSKHNGVERVKLLLGVGRVVAYVVVVLACRYFVVVRELVMMQVMLLLLLLFVVVGVAADDHSWVRVGVLELGEMAMV